MRKTKETLSQVVAIDDPFERLPEHILHHILALLRSPKEAARTAVVSRTWHMAWSSYPIFNFHVSDFCTKVPECSTIHYSPDELEKINDRFLDFVDRAMSRLRGHNVAFPRLIVGAMLIKINHSRALFDKLIGMALDSGVQVLQLDFKELDNQDDSYSVPARVFSSGSIKILALGQGLITPLDKISTVNMSSLRSLIILFVPLNKLMLQKLLRGCPLLEEIKLLCGKLLTQVIISGPNRLRRLTLIGHVNRVEIEAPSLEEFICHHIGPPGTFLPQFIVGPEPGTLLSQVIMDRCPRVKHLKLRGCAFTQHRIQQLLSEFPLLESLTIGDCEGFEKIMISNPMLEKIEIDECKGLDDIEIGSANLSCFRYRTRKMQLPFIRMHNPTAISACEADFGNNWTSIPGHDWFIQLREFLTRSCQFRSIAFVLFVVWEEENQQDTHYPLPLLPCDVDRLNLCVWTVRSSHAAILNKLLSVCHPTTLRVSSNCDFLKFVCEKLENGGGDEDDCCRCSGHRKCWLHELKGVEIDRITLSDHDRGPLDWLTLNELLPKFRMSDGVCFKLQWK